VFNRTTAELLLQLHSCDWYVDNGVSAASQGYKYKVLILQKDNYQILINNINNDFDFFNLKKIIFQVFQNRSYETIASLYDGDNNLKLQFRVRLHGHDNRYAADPWPTWSNTPGLNQFTTMGNTPTGLVECDLNSPEGDPMEYGPFPITRFVKGLQGTLLLLLTSI
jgi:hypothetical protein